MIRIENIDPPREIPGSADSIVHDLAALGFPGNDLVYQSNHIHLYENARDQLLANGQAYPCACTRKDFDPTKPYPGTCRNGVPSGRKARSVRIKSSAEAIHLDDRIQGHSEWNLEQSSGDFVIWRTDGLPAYQLAAAVDDAVPGITEVVRGADLLESTPRQILIQQKLGLTSPAYAHIPVVTHEGFKLSKRTHSDPVALRSEASVLRDALSFLGIEVPSELAVPEIWTSAIERWEIDNVDRTTEKEWPLVRSDSR